MKLRIDYSEIDQNRHGKGCECGLCNRNGKSYGVAILFDDPEEHNRRT